MIKDYTIVTLAICVTIGVYKSMSVLAVDNDTTNEYLTLFLTFPK